MVSESYYGSNSNSKSSQNFIVRTFGYVGFGLLISALVASLLGILFTNVLPITSEDAMSDKNAVIYLGVMIGSGLMLFILSFILNFTILRRNRENVNIVPFILYAVCMGALLSGFTIFIPWYILGVTFLFTVVIFAGLAGLSYLLKDKMGAIAITLMGFGSGLFLLTLFWFILYLVAGSFLGTSLGILSLFISYGAFIYMMLITMFDIGMVIKSNQYGDVSKATSLYYAYRIYVDFIYVFLRILYFVLRASSKK